MNITLTYAQLRKLRERHSKPQDQEEALLLKGIQAEIHIRENPDRFSPPVTDNPDGIGYEP